MVEDFDPSLQRDAAAAETATQRSHDMANHVQKLSAEMHVMKGELAANTSFTKEIVERQLQLVQDIAGIKAKFEKLDVKALTEATEVLASMKGGFIVLGWLGVFAKWLATIAAGAAVLWAAFHWGPPK